MEQVKLYCAGVCRGEITLRPEGGRTEVLAVMPDPGDGLYRVELLGERGGLMLGVMEPAGRELTVCRRLYSRDVAGLGRLLRGEARCSFRFGDGASPGAGKALSAGGDVLFFPGGAGGGVPVRGIRL